MPEAKFWKERFDELGIHSTGPGTTKTDIELEEHRQIFARSIQPWLENLQGPILDFGCGVGRWVKDLPKPYLGLDLLPEHLEICRKMYGHLQDVEFRHSAQLQKLPDKSFESIFTCTVLQHIVEPSLRQEVIRQFHRILRDDGVFLSVEWAAGQWECDWCRRVARNDFRKWFRANAVGEVIENGRRHTIWICRKRRSIFLKLRGMSRSEKSVGL